MVPILSWKSFIYRNLNTIHIVMCIAGAIGCVLPLNFQESYIEDFPFATSMMTLEFYIFCAVCFTLATPLILDQIVDMIIHLSTETNIARTRAKILFLSDIEISLFLTGFLIVPIIAVIPDLQNPAFTYTCCLRSQFMLTFGTVITALSRYDEGFWPSMLLSLSLLLFMVSLIMAAFSTNLNENEPVTRATNIAWNIWPYIALLAALLVLVVCIYHVVKIMKQTRNSTIIYFINLFRKAKKQSSHG